VAWLARRNARNVESVRRLDVDIRGLTQLGELGDCAPRLSAERTPRWMAAHKPSFGWVLFAQSLSAAGEVFGQRLQRRFHHGSQIRMLNTTVVYSAVQAFVVLLLCELLLPESITLGQGSLWMWQALVAHPAVFINAITNTVYWVALLFVLRHPLGVVLVVLAFVLASFFIAPFQAIVGIQGDKGTDAGASVLAVVGSVLCLAELPAPWLVRLEELSGLQERTKAWYRLADLPPLQLPEAPPASSRKEERDEEEQAGLLAEPATATMTELVLPVQESSVVPAPPADTAVVLPQSPIALGAAWLVLALTAGVGIVCTVVMERQMGIGAFGYAAIDQVLLPVTTLPLTMAAVRWTPLASWIGEPTAGRDATVRESFSRTWREVDWVSLVPFRGLMFGREFLFFWLATAFSDLAETYLEMTILRVILCWLGSLLISMRLRRWGGLSSAEAAISLHPANLLLRTLGSAVLILSYAILSG
jgi:hypothetical protein